PRAGGGAGFRWGRRSAVGPSLESIRAEEAVVTRWVLLGVALGLACQPSAADHEELGDRAYAAGAYRDALAEYELGLKAHPGSAGDARMADSLLFVYGMAAVRARDCATAVPAFEGVIRRQREPAVADRAREGLGLCSLVEGQQLLEKGKPSEAEDWFRRATAPGSPADVVRGAFLGLGDVKLA